MSNNNPSNAITIPLESRALGEFIAELLGQRRLIEQSFHDRRFEINMAWLLNLDQIIEQRLAAQNAGKLMSFSARIYFANGRIVTLESQLAFRSFNDMSNELSVGVDLRWTYLIQFPLAQLPEKQEIRFFAFTNKDVRERTIDRKPSKSFVSFDAGDERLGYGIHFTDVTWGEDLSAHISNYITSKTEAIPKWKTWLRGIRSSVLFPVGLFAGPLVAMFTIGNSLPLRKLIDLYGPMEEISHRLHDTGEKLDFLVDATTARVLQDIPIFEGFFRIFVASLFIVGLFYLLLLRKASFISINDTSQRYLDKYGRNFDFIKYGIGVALVVAIVGGVFAGRIYDAIKPWL